MPGKQEHSKDPGANISRLEKDGYPHKQAIAIGLDEARREGAHIPKKGGGKKSNYSVTVKPPWLRG